VHIAKRDDVLVAKNLVGGDLLAHDLAEDAVVGHLRFPL
jgi:hypothetical protein